MKNIIATASLFMLLVTGCNQNIKDGVIMSETVSVEKAFEIFEKNKNSADFGVLDVRTPAEISEGMIPGAQHIDITTSEFVEKAGVLDRNRTWLVYCRSGGRSARAVQVLQSIGFTKLYNMSGGFLLWQAAGYPSTVPQAR